MVIEVLIEVAHGGALGYAPRPRARGARDPGGDYGDGWWVRACERGEARRCENARMHCDEAMCFLRLLPASATCRLLRFLLAPVLRGHPLLRPPAPPADTGVS